MILCLDVGNSQIFGGVFDEGRCTFHFRRNSASRGSSDEIGVFLRSVLRENGVDPGAIEHVAICTVVPDITHSLKNAAIKYFKSEPFLLQAGVKTGLKIKVRNPLEVGADRIANSIGALQRYPGKNLIVVDYGTATTFEAISAEKEYHGGVILPGLGTSMEALELKTALLPKVQIVHCEKALGRSTVESIQSGLYFSNVGAAKELISRFSAECFPGSPPTVIATGGFSRLFEDSGIFSAVIPDLVLEGLYLAWEMNTRGS